MVDLGFVQIQEMDMEAVPGSVLCPSVGKERRIDFCVICTSGPLPCAHMYVIYILFLFHMCFYEISGTQRREMGVGQRLTHQGT